MNVNENLRGQIGRDRSNVESGDPFAGIDVSHVI